MNRILGLILCTFLLFSCGQSPEAQTAPTAKAAATNVAEKTQTTPKPSPRPSSRYTTNTSRQKTEVEQNYPYDIDITNAKKTSFNTKDVFAKNGKPTVLVFWLTTCVPCHYELKAMKDKYAQWQEEADFNFYAISTDFSKNYEKFIAQVEKNQWEWPVFHDTNREFRQVMPGALNGLPQSFILDKNGEIVYHKRKYSSGDEDILFAKVKELVKK